MAQHINSTDKGGENKKRTTTKYLEPNLGRVWFFFEPVLFHAHHYWRWSLGEVLVSIDILIFLILINNSNNIDNGGNSKQPLLQHQQHQVVEKSYTDAFSGQIDKARPKLKSTTSSAADRVSEA